jgi:hypothetical protein
VTYTKFKLGGIWGLQQSVTSYSIYNIHKPVSYHIGTSCRYSFRKKVNDGEENCKVRRFIIYSLHQNANRKIEGFFPPYLFITLFNGHYHCCCFSSSRHRPLNFPARGEDEKLTQRRPERWAGAYRSSTEKLFIQEDKVGRTAHMEGMRKIHNFGTKPEGK